MPAKKGGQSVALVGGAALLSRRLRQGIREPAWGTSPTIPAAKPQGAIPTLKMPTAQGWSAGQAPVPAPGLKVNAFATGLDHPRWIEVLPNGDVLVAEAMFMERPPRSLFDYAMISTMRRADAMGVSANYSVPVMALALGEARKAMRSATSLGLAGRPSGDAAECVHDDPLAPSKSVAASAARRSAKAMAASVSTHPGETRTTRTPLGVTSFDRLLLFVESAALAAA